MDPVAHRALIWRFPGTTAQDTARVRRPKTWPEILGSKECRVRAEAFTTGNRALILRAIEVGLIASTGAIEGLVTVRESSPGGLPRTRAAWSWPVSLQCSNPGTVQLASIEPQDSLILKPNRVHWICLHARIPGHEFSWAGAAAGLEGWSVQDAYRGISERWPKGYLSKAKGLALRVLASDPSVGQESHSTPPIRPRK